MQLASEVSFAEIANENNAVLIATSGNANIESTIKTIEFIHISNDISQYHNKERIRTIADRPNLTQKIYESTENLMDNFRYTRYGQKQENDQNLLKKSARQIATKRYRF